MAISSNQLAQIIGKEISFMLCWLPHLLILSVEFSVHYTHVYLQEVVRRK